MKVVILIGGNSTRMGQDKAFVVYKGQRLLDRAIALARHVNSDYFLSVSNEQFQHLGHEYPCIIDNRHNLGPLSGIESALSYLRQDILVLPVDMPLLTKKVLKPLIVYGKTSALQVGSNIQALPSYWSFKDLASIHKSIASHKLSLKPFFKEDINLIPYQGDENLFLNINSPDELRRHRP